MLTEKTFDTGEVILNYVEGPNTNPPIVLVHGVTARWQTFRSIIPHLSSNWHLYACDLRGHGSSGRLTGTYTIPDFIHDTGLWLESILTEPCILLGHSLGALVSFGVAAQKPALISALILSDPPLIERDNARFAQTPLPKQFTRLYEQATSVSTLEELLQLMKGNDPEISQSKRNRAEQLFQADPDILASVIERRLPLGFDFEAALAGVQCPTLLLQADPTMKPALMDDDVAFAKQQLQTYTHRVVEGA
ncbi:MAG: alpha/beta hydrolase, partial [Chloroflexota bacterium]